MHFKQQVLLVLTTFVLSACTAVSTTPSSAPAPTPPSAVTTGNSGTFKLPPYVMKHWRNGLTVFLMPDDEVPLTELRLVIKAGAARDGNQPGLAYLTAQSLRLGGVLFDKQTLDGQLDFYGAGLGISVSKDATVVSLSGASDDIENLLPLLADVTLNPLFPVNEYEKLRLRHLNQLAQRKQHPREVLGDYFDRLVYPPGHPYA
ncbi:MAG: insulinase family protein, partial [Gammaproteobacteria bacterium]|nr:insulinase family protein [Gammaproteobacteria bacterium]